MLNNKKKRTLLFLRSHINIFYKVAKTFILINDQYWNTQNNYMYSNYNFYIGRSGYMRRGRFLNLNIKSYNLNFLSSFLCFYILNEVFLPIFIISEENN